MSVGQERSFTLRPAPRLETSKPPLRVRQRLGKYRVERRLGRGGFADVYAAFDTVEGLRVALKLPQPELLEGSGIETFLREVRLTARLDHPNVLPVKNADFIDGRFVIAYPLGDQSLADRLSRRLAPARALRFAEQALEALAHAHGHRVMHGDVKPDNFILFGDDLRLSDFGIAKVAARTIQASGSGTLGFMAPEQAMGRPSLRSDVFSAGLLVFRLFAGRTPEWPFEWPPPGVERIRRSQHPEFLDVLRRSLRMDPRARYADCQAMLRAFRSARSKANQRKRSNGSAAKRRPKADWRSVQLRAFNRKYSKALAATHACRRCERPVSESMIACPWCSTSRKVFRDGTRFPASCPRCKRGVKLDWSYCPHCHGRGIGPLSDRSYTDKRYTSRCANRRCRGELMPFMKYCPWCRIKVRKPWPIEGSRDRCGSCGWGVLSEYWKTCPWCAKSLHGRNSSGRSRR